MRKFLLLGLAFLASIWFGGLNAQNPDIVDIPDANFKQALLDHNPIIDTNGDGEISVNEAEAFDGAMDVSNKSIQNLTGIEAFVNITRLYASNNQISGSLDLSNNTSLEYLHSSNNAITNVNITQNTALRRLDLSDNQLESLDISANVELDRVWLYYNKLSSIDLTNNTALEHLAIDNNELKALDVSQNVNLLTLGVFYNDLKHIDISNNHFLTLLNAWNNNLISVNVANGNNENMSRMKVNDNPKLVCVQHDANFNPDSKPCTGVNGQEGWCKDESAIWSTDCSISVQTNQVDNLVNLYPNPAQNNVVLSFNNVELDHITVYNTQGMKVLESNHFVLNLETLSSGVYFVEVNTVNNGTVYRKLIKN